MIYKPGDIFYVSKVDVANEDYEGAVICVEDSDGCSCNKCVFSEDREGGSSCPAKCYDEHPCYHSDRGDEFNVHFEKYNQ